MSASHDPELLREHAAFVRRVARAVLSDEHSIEEVVQGTFLQAVRHPPERSSIRTWMRRVARNLAISHWRAGRRRERRERAAARPEGVPGPAEAVQRLETQRRVVEAVMALDEPYRVVIAYRYFDELGPSAIATRLQLPVQTVKTRLKRARAALRARLESEYGGDGRECAIALLALQRAPWRGLARVALLGGAVVVKKSLVVVVVLAVCLTGWVSWRTLKRGSPRGVSRAESRAASAPVPAPPGAELQSQPAGSRSASPDAVGNPPGTGSPAAALLIPDDRLYVGDDEVFGTVVTRDKEPLAGATVWWLPTMFFDGDTAQRRERFTTTTDAAGRFAFQTLPHAPVFDILAVGGGHAGYRRDVSHAPGAATELTIPASRWAYSRYSFVDEAGEPVRVAGLRLSLEPGAVHSSFDPALDARTMWILARLGLPLEDVPNNGVAWVSEEGYARKAQQRTLTIPGYEPVILDEQCRSAGDWPEGRQVVLTPKPLPPGKCSPSPGGVAGRAGVGV